jgi:hypothetical protein
MSALKKITAFVPGPALVYVGQWIDLLSSTVLANPVWQVAADKLALAAGAILTIFISIGWADTSKEILLRRFYIGCCIVVAGFLTCWAIWVHLRPPSPGEISPDSTWWQGVWETAYVFTQSILVCTISVGALSIRDDRSWLFWLKVIVAGVLAALVVYLVFWR